MASLRRFLFILLLALGTATHAQRGASLALEAPWHGLPQIPVTLNDAVEGRFIVDTAASKTMLSRETVRRLGLAGRGAPARLSGSTGRTATHYHRLASLRLGTRDYRQLTAFEFPRSADIGPVDGLVGADILRDHVLEFDNRHGRFRLLDPRLDPAHGEDRWAIIPFHERDDGLLILEVTIGRARMPALFDTGAAQNIVNPAAARAIGLRLFPDSASRSAIGGASGHVQEMHQIDISRLSIGDLAFGWTRIGVTDLAIFDALGIGDGPAMLLSAAMLSDRRFIVDYPRDRLLVERASD
ncbi:aspartyl protease family protein [Parasphingopyxis sp.]|uniref:aspartyl protease family protein n=1 Tax=Parasphingopyxis sp. TaxID=1920299 RepID=UPI002622E2FF|nr:aspartyl protease family protein [Parasphingopyxis sp.]